MIKLFQSKKVYLSINFADTLKSPKITFKISFKKHFSFFITHDIILDSAMK